MAGSKPNIPNVNELIEVQNNDTPLAIEQAIVKLLHSRFKLDQPYTQLGQYKLIIVNPSKPLELLNNATLEAYGNYGYKDILLDRFSTAPEPHVYEMATRAYLLMRRKGEDQVIVLRGASGSGKSTTKQHLIKELLYLSTHTVKEKKVKKQILGVNTIFESFGTAASTFNETASCLGQFQTLKFSERGRITGCVTSIFLLDKSRISRSSIHQYNIFYQLLAGTTNDEKRALHITHNNFNYIRHLNQRDTQRDFIGFNSIKEALKLCGFKTKTIAQMCQLLAAILHLGNIQFVDGKFNFTGDGSYSTFANSGGAVSSSGRESCYIKNKETLSLVAAALGVATSKLETALTHKVKLIGNEFCTAFLNPVAASEQRDSLAETLYTALLLWITNAMNQKFESNSNEKNKKSISILDTVGFQVKDNTSQRASTFHDLCVNYTIEHLHQYCFDRNFNQESPSNFALLNDGAWSNKILNSVKRPPTSLKLYHGTGKNPFSLIQLVNKESKRFQNYALDATDSNLLSLLFQKKKSSQNNPNSDYATLLNPSTPSYSFTIRHFDSVNVNYCVDGFLESNLDFISPDFLHMFRYNCTNEFVHNLFDVNSLTGWITDNHPRDERTVIKAQLPVWSKIQYPKLNKKESIESSEKQSSDSNEEKWSQKKKKVTLSNSQSCVQSVFDQIIVGVDELKEILDQNFFFEVFHLSPNGQLKPDIYDPQYVQHQIEILQLAELAAHTNNAEILHGYTYENFVSHYQPIIDAYLPSDDFDDDIDETVVDGDEEEEEGQRKLKKTKIRIHDWVQSMQWTETDIKSGQSNVWLSFDFWRFLENQIRSLEKEERLREKERLAIIEAEKEALRQAAIAAAIEAEELEAAQRAAAEAEAAKKAAELAAIAADRYSNDKSHLEDDCGSYVSHEDDKTETEAHYDHFGKKSEWGDDDDQRLADGFGPNLDMSRMMEDYSVQPEEQVEEVNLSSIRHWWTRFVQISTWWVPSSALKYIGKMSREDVQMAWREKVTLCLLIFLFSGSIIFSIVGLGAVICPGTKELYSKEDVRSHQSIVDYWVSIRGKVYDVTKFVATDHGTPTYVAGKYNLEPLAGRDLSYTFPPPLTEACAGLVNDPSIFIMPNESIVLGPFVHLSGPQQPEKSLEKLRDPQWSTKYFLPVMNMYKKGDLVISMKQIKDDYHSWGRLIASIDDKVYDLTDYMATARRYPTGVSGSPNYHYLHPSVENIFVIFGGKDATAEWNKYSAGMDEQKRIQNKACLDNVFYIGRLDYRESTKCTFVNYLLLSFAVIMSLVILVKFLAALQFGSAPTPEDHDKFVICQVPCYTEDEESLRKTIDSLTAMTYDDKHKLLFLIADGMIIGSGNDRPTPRILLDILGHDENDDPEALIFKSIGEGSKQLNYGKVYSGVYQYEGHVVPYIVVIKVGKSSERTKPGNRGKRDSQIICMNFLSKVHFDSEMSPLELEIYYHIKHIIGIDPSFYEYILMVDSDTEVYPDSLNRLISCMLHDSRIIGLCGETELGNEDRSWTTMIQVYEYYISHHLVKAFESLFGSVTCLPGCFCMYRIRTAIKHQPLIVSPNIIHAYSDNQVDTLHKKNLLHLGEDRYLTTLMMKNFPQYKMMFTPYAKCKTVAPDEWRVLLSQRRRWINSTIHNLLELILLQELCGFCCLSMRFVVIADLIGTITLPSSVLYLMYLIYQVVSGSGPIPTIALGMLAGAYGLQSLIFIFKRQWQHIGWMVIYILAIPIFSFFIPLYAFWHFDDFSWGNTRVVVGDKKKQIIVTDDEKFDEKMIPLKKWSVYEQEMWETQTVGSEASVSKSSCYLHDCSSETQSLVSESRKHHRHHHKHHHYTHPDETKTIHSHSSMKSNTSIHSKTSKQQLLPPLISDFTEDESFGQFSIDLSCVLKTRSIQSQGNNPELKDSSKPRVNDIRMTMLPEDDEIEREIKRILQTSNLMVLTKKQVRSQLSNTFGVDLTIKKGFINATIERLLEFDEV